MDSGSAFERVNAALAEADVADLASAVGLLGQRLVALPEFKKGGYKGHLLNEFLHRSHNFLDRRLAAEPMTAR